MQIPAMQNVRYIYRIFRLECFDRTLVYSLQLTSSIASIVSGSLINIIMSTSWKAVVEQKQSARATAIAKVQKLLEAEDEAAAQDAQYLNATGRSLHSITYDYVYTYW